MHSLLLLRDGAPEVSFRLTDTHTIGRSSTCDIQVLRPELSRQHANIAVDGDVAVITDLGSQNGTFVDGVAVRKPTRLSAGDQIQLGQVSFLFDAPVEVRHSSHGDRTLFVVSEESGGPCHVEPLAENLPPPEVASLMRIFQLTCEVAERLEMDLLLPSLLNSVIDHFKADRGYILLGKSPAALRPAATHGHERDIAVSRGLIRRAFDSKTPLLIRDALESLSFVGSRSVLEHNLRSVMVMPLLVDNRPIGIVQIDKQTADAFGQDDLARFALLAKTAAFTVENAVRFEREKKRVEAELKRPDVDEFVGRSPQVEALLTTALKAASSPARVLITGESGVGKELIARLIHRRSPRADGPLVCINCGALPENTVESELFGHQKGAFTGAVSRKKGVFECADGGTLFLDEVGELPLELQVKLLRALQEGCFYPMGFERPVSVDVRVVAATNRDLAMAVREGRFREDLYYRLNVVSIHVPPLRERQGDIPLLLEHFLARYARNMGKAALRVSSEAMAKLVEYSYPGNVRELSNIAERLTVLGDGLVQLADLPRELLLKGEAPTKGIQTFDLKTVMAEVERDMIRAALSETGGVKAAACRMLGISRPTLDKKISELGIEV